MPPSSDISLSSLAATQRPNSRERHPSLLFSSPDPNPTKWHQSIPFQCIPFSRRIKERGRGLLIRRKRRGRIFCLLLLPFWRRTSFSGAFGLIALATHRFDGGRCGKRQGQRERGQEHVFLWGDVADVSDRGHNLLADCRLDSALILAVWVAEIAREPVAMHHRDAEIRGGGPRDEIAKDVEEFPSRGGEIHHKVIESPHDLRIGIGCVGGMISFLWRLFVLRR